MRYNEKRIAEFAAEKDSAEHRARTSRLAKWKELSAKANADLELPAQTPERLQLLGFLSDPFGMSSSDQSSIL